MNNELTMNVSCASGGKDNRTIYVMFSDKTRSVEIRLPENKVMNNKGFTPEELSQLLEYTKNEKATIEQMAASVSPLKALMGK